MSRLERWSTPAAVVLATAVLGLFASGLMRPSRSTPPVVPTGASVASAPAAPAAPAAARLADPAEQRRRDAIAGRWNRLTASQQQVLAPLSDDWAQLTPDQRRKWLDLSSRFHTYTLDEQERIRARMVEWARLSVSERAVARLNFQELRLLSQKERLEQWEAWQGLDADQRKSFSDKALAAAVATTALRRTELSTPVPKSSSVAVDALPTATPRAVGATVVQAPLGATTSLVNRMQQGAAPTPQGTPKIAATPEYVDPNTLLPQRAARPAAAEPAPVEGGEGGSSVSSGAPGSAGAGESPPSGG